MKFEKVSFETFLKDVRGCQIKNGYFDEDIKRFYDNIKLPERKTAFSAGYDFAAPMPFYLRAGFNYTLPTGIKCKFSPEEAEHWHLKLYIRSSLGVKYGIILRNCTGVIDGDYYNNPDNEGDIMLALYNNGQSYRFDAGERIMQGVFEPHGTTEDDHANGVRRGGVGSTGK